VTIAADVSKGYNFLVKLSNRETDCVLTFNFEYTRKDAAIDIPLGLTEETWGLSNTWVVLLPQEKLAAPAKPTTWLGFKRFFEHNLRFSSE
jgi:hypothetical protein